MCVVTNHGTAQNVKDFIPKNIPSQFERSATSSGQELCEKIYKISVRHAITWSYISYKGFQISHYITQVSGCCKVLKDLLDRKFLSQVF